MIEISHGENMVTSYRHPGVAMLFSHCTQLLTLLTLAVGCTILSTNF